MSSEQPSTSRKPWHIWLVLLAILVPALLFGLSQRPLYKIQEVRIAETAREMLVNADYSIPRLNGLLRLQKPPLPYWFTTISYQGLGISPFAARIPSVLFTLLTAGLLFIWLRQSTTLNPAINTALILVTSFIALRYARSAEADASLMLFITTACYFGYQAIYAQNTNKWPIYGFYIATGLAFLCKGPAGIAIPLLTVAIAAILNKQSPKLRVFGSPFGLTLLAIIAFGWYVWILLTMPELANQFFGHQLDETFMTGTHKQPIWWYLQHICQFFLPWGVLLPAALLWAYKKRPWSPEIQFSLVWIGVVFVLLTATVNKQVQYALLFAPPLSILLGDYIAQAEGGFARLNKWLMYLMIAGLTLSLANSLRHLPLFNSWMLWLPALLATSFILKYKFKISALTYPVHIIAAMVILVYCFGELRAGDETEKDDAADLMSKTSQYETIFQLYPGDGALSFYAQRIIKPLDPNQLEDQLNHDGEILLISKTEPAISNAKNEALQTEGRLTLWRVTKAIQPK